MAALSVREQKFLSCRREHCQGKKDVRECGYLKYSEKESRKGNFIY